jgi:hypothetical protein
MRVFLDHHHEASSDSSGVSSTTGYIVYFRKFLPLVTFQ